MNGPGLKIMTWAGWLGRWVNGLQFQRGHKLFVWGAQVPFFFFFWKLTYLKKIIWTRGAGPHLCLSLALRNQKENKNKTRLITIQQYKSQTAKKPDGKLKNKDETYWDFSDEKRWRLRTKRQRKRGKSVAVITNIEGKKIWDELGFFLGLGSCGLFSLWTENWKFKKNKIAGVKDSNQSCSAKNIPTCHHAGSNKV